METDQNYRNFRICDEVLQPVRNVQDNAITFSLNEMLELIEDDDFRSTLLE